LFQNEEYLSYASCGLSYFASGDLNSFKELIRTSYGVTRDSDFFEKSKGFKAVTGAEVINIDRTGKMIEVKDTRTGEIYKHEYGKLVLATGSAARKPEFPVAVSSRIRRFKKPEDAMAFRDLAQKGAIDRSVIVGGGFIGCEVAEATAGLWGIDTIVIEKKDQILPGLLDREIAAIVQRHMSDRGVNVMTGMEPQRIDLEKNEKPVIWLASGERIETDYVFLCLGFRPESYLAERCGLAIGKSGGILVDQHLRTSDPDIYAGGDCIEQSHRITGRKVHMPMGSLANRHGRVIAENLAGNSCEFRGVLGTFFLKVFDLNIGSVGLRSESASSAGFEVSDIWGTFPDKPDYYPGSKAITLKLTYGAKDNRLYGLQAVGEGDVCRPVDVFSCFLQSGRLIEDLFDFEHGYAPPYSESLHPLYQLASMAKAQRKGMNFISPDTAIAVEDGGTMLLDIREPYEVKDNPLNNAAIDSGVKIVNIPLNDLRSRMGDLDKTNRIVITCQRGPRSYQAAVILKSAGFSNIGILGGGLQAHK
jgi:NADPH-dependent 2,4-dienoyl-CoA reductase/sulfur reductase-like enzyme/rhodanese-related sulfurtransferase